ncbi:hypothetical protein JTE90_026303 [Oedothorax gibbosus]|uniref:Protein BCCIP homolog n=1 Tax=Oedothorax gibbosus TaxID=931172 RepID=A0AAV6U679_9ARAC|nr:hypothetical protein JTE90_026303 [Oedothorax gibbosus]
MAGPRKQRRLEQNDSSSDSDESVNQEDEEMETIQVDFDVKMPEPSDFHGIKNLLHQLFLKAHINTSELTDLLISQRKITGVVKQADGGDEEMDADDDPEDLDASFGVFSVVNITEHSTKECVNEIHTYLLSHGKKGCDDEKFQMLRRILEDKKKHVGLIISERMVNIPAQIAVPMYSSLSYDLSKATAKGEAFDFEYFILISKIVVFKDGSKDENVLYTNAEEELIAEVATLSYDFSVSSELDSGLAGNWTDDDIEGKRKRRVLLFPASQLEHINSKMSSELAT